MFRGQQITQDAHSFVGKQVFVSAHARRGSGMRQYRGTLTKIGYSHLTFKNGVTFPLNFDQYDIMLSEG